MKTSHSKVLAAASKATPYLVIDGNTESGGQTGNGSNPGTIEVSK